MSSTRQKAIFLLIVIANLSNSVFAKISSSFSPQIDLEAKVIQTLGQAQSSIDMAIYTFSSNKIKTLLP